MKLVLSYLAIAAVGTVLFLCTLYLPKNRWSGFTDFMDSIIMVISVLIIVLGVAGAIHAIHITLKKKNSRPRPYDRFK